MSIKVSQAFERTSANPIDETIALTKAKMLTVNDNLMPDYYFTICQDDGKLYLYDKTATPDPATGKFTEFTGGGGDSSDGSYHTDATLDTDINDTTTVVAADLPTGFDFTKIVIGETLIYDDAGTVGVITAVNGTTDVTVTTMTIVGGGGSGTGGHTIVDTDGNPVADEPKLQFTGLDVQDNSTDSETEVSAFGLNTDSLDDIVESASVPGSAVSSNGLVYSTTEQVVGKWIDGKPIYQKTIQTTAPAPSGGTPGASYIPLGVSVDKLISYHGLLEVINGIDVPFGCFAYAEGLNVYVYKNTATETQYRNTVRLMNGNSAWAGYNAYITVRYTKTS